MAGHKCEATVWESFHNWKCGKPAKYYVKKEDGGKKFLCGTHKNAQEKRGRLAFPIPKEK